MYSIVCPAGEPLLVPQDPSEDHAYFAAADVSSAREHLDENGYTVLRNVIPHALCDNVEAFVRSQLARTKGYLYRQATSNPELNEFNERGFIMNSVLNIQDVPSASLGGFRQSALDVLTHAGIQAFLREAFGEPGKLVQSMYFQGNTATWAHQDTYYLDAERIGTMVAVWVALEDIQPGAGRFFVYPKSHLIDLKKNGGDFDIAFNHDRYKQLMVDIIKSSGLECVAPALRKGDALFWNSKTIHGSLRTQQPEFSRASLTAHYLPSSARFLQFQARTRPLRLRDYNGMAVHHPKNLDEPAKRAVLWVETTFPGAFRTAKKIAIKVLTSVRN